ncbi:MAG: PAS domain-containing protein [Candidatus Kariarchaeaceae archaeon]
MNKTSEMFLIDKTFDPDETFMVVWKMSELGPEVVKSESVPLKDEETDLMRLGIYFSTAIGQGDSYTPGLFGPLPVLDSEVYNALVFSKRITDKNLEDPRFKGENFVLVAIIYPIFYEHLFYNRKEISKAFDGLMSSMEDVSDIDEHFLSAIEIKIHTVAQISRMELRLQLEQDRLNFVFNNTSDAIIVYSENGEIIQTNTQAKKMYGVYRDNYPFPANHFRKIHSLLSDEEVVHLLDEVLTLGEVTKKEPVITDAGKKIHCLRKIRVVELSEKRFIFEFIKDITVRELDQTKHQALQDFTLRVFHGIEEGILVINRDYDILRCNKAMNKVIKGKYDIQEGVNIQELKNSFLIKEIIEISNLILEKKMKKISKAVKNSKKQIFYINAYPLKSEVPLQDKKKNDQITGVIIVAFKKPKENNEKSF